MYLLSSVTLTPLWIVPYYLLHNYLIPSWCNTKRPGQLASHLISLTHATFVTVASALMLSTHPNLITFSNLIVLSSSYFLYDICYMLCYSPSRMYLIHHLATLAVWYLSLAYQCGENLILFSVLLGEYTNVIRIPWRIAKENGYTNLARRLETIFRYNFLIARCILAPIHVIFHIPTIFNLPMPLAGRLTIMLSAGTLLVGSVIWSSRLIHKSKTDRLKLSVLIEELET